LSFQSILLLGIDSQLFLLRGQCLFRSKLWVRDIVLHPVVIAGLLGLFFLDGNDLLIIVLSKSIEFFVPAILPLCLIVTGAKLSQFRLLEKL